MSETNDLADDGFHEIQLSGKQLVFLFMATTLVAVVIFLCGVHVGRGVKGDRADDSADNLAVSPATTPVASTLSQPPPTGAPPAGEAPAPAQEPVGELSYPKRLQSESAAPEKLKPQEPTTPAAAAQHAVTPPAPVAANQPAARPTPGTGATVAHGQPGNWIVQVTAIQDRSAATAIAKRLSAKGYPAFVLDPVSGSPVIYRVQVGGYTDRSEADQVKRRLEKDEQYKPLVRAR